VNDRRRVTRLAADLARLTSEEPAPADFERWTEERLATTPPDRWPMIALTDSRFHHRLIARYLSRRAMALFVPEGKIREALKISETASTILDILVIGEPDDAALTIMRAETYVDQATYLTWLAQYGGALDTIELAEMLLATILTPDADLIRARLLLARASIYSDPDICRYDDALALLNRAEEAFRWMEEHARHLAAERVRANVLIALGQLETARELLFGLLQPTEAANAHEHARLMHDIGVCAERMGNATEALQFSLTARAALMRFGDNPAEIGRVDWTIGRALEIAGDYEGAAGALNRAAEAFSHADLLDLWVRARLDFVHVALTRDPDADMRIICESIAATSIALDQKDANRRRHATAEALDYLRRVAIRRELTADTVAYVRAYLDEIAIRPARRFIPAEPEQTM
jgi:tetratricopeptide (TPR) repeat protein